MADLPRHVILNANLIPGGTLGSPWRRATKPPEHFTSIDHYLDVARVAERGLLDAVFLADSPDVQAKDWNSPSRLLDPFVAQTVIAAHTERIGLVVTATTSYNDPYNLARSFAALAAVSGGRVGWNYVVTGGDAAARNYSLDAAPPKSERYARAEEFIDVVTALWDSAPAGSIVGDKASGRYLDPALVRPIDHDGTFFRVAGPLKTPPLPHGRPVLIQAGASTHGVELGARTADAIYSAHVDPTSAMDRRAEIRRRAADAGRDPDSVKLLPGLIVVLAGTEAAARERERELIDLIPDDVQLLNLAERLGVDPALLDLDAPFPWGAIPDENTDAGSRGQRAVLLENVRRTGSDTRGAARLLASGSVHAKVVGDAQQVADFITDWFVSGACDGFNLMIDELPGGLEDFVEQVLPILRGRGIFRTEYDTTSLRGHYGL
ncbi:NtaA/DmoA family FMN-dependent monooxygenase [Rhodococcus sp. NPDC058521]|uniref:NtaA/DmoA family FMN-dependent monooxygenase n=1 Tax=Rhodococcus sp. NPDC058521 TaxID=3346536 RepID=UPI003653B645